MTVARTARVAHMVAEAKKDGPPRSDEAYIQGVAPAGQVGKWTRLVPAFGSTRVSKCFTFEEPFFSLVLACL